MADIDREEKQKKAAAEGADAHKRGDHRKTCPHPAGSPEEAAWHIAYGTAEAIEKRAAAQQAEAAKPKGIGGRH